MRHVITRIVLFFDERCVGLIIVQRSLSLLVTFSWRGLLNVSLYHHNFAVSQQKLCRVELGIATLSRFRVGVCLIRHCITRIVLFSDEICVGLVLK